MNLVTGAALATVNRLPVFLLPGDTYATRHQGPVLQQLQHPVDADLTVNDVFRPVSRFFDRITRPEQLLTALPAAIRTLVDPVETGAVVLSLPQDVQSHAYDFPAEFFAERDWIDPPSAPGRRRDRSRGRASRRGEEADHHRRRRGHLLRRHRRAGAARRRASAPRSPRPSAARAPCSSEAWWQVGGIGLEGTPATNTLASEADLVLTVGSRLTDFATGSHSIFANPDVRFASINVNVHDADRLGATGIVGDAKRGLAALTEAVAERAPVGPSWRAAGGGTSRRLGDRAGGCAEPGPAVRQVRGASRFRRRHHHRRGPHPGPDHRCAAGTRPPGDVIVAAAGGPPG